MTMTENGLPAQTTSQRFNLRDGQRPVTFLGWKLGDADSQSGNDVRWTELALYRTLSNKYVFEKIGRSDVFHSARCTRRSKGKEYTTLDDAMPEDAGPEDTAENLFVPCPDCKPDRNESPIFAERDIPSVAVFETPVAAIESMYRNDNDGGKFLSRVARTLLEKAADNDEQIARILHSPADIT